MTKQQIATFLVQLEQLQGEAEWLIQILAYQKQKLDALAEEVANIGKTAA